jgi:phosphate-selective porin OprO/OprP
MKLVPKLLAVAVLAGLSSTASAEITIDVIGGSEVSFEGLLQADFYNFDVDHVDYGADTAVICSTSTDCDGAEKIQELRRAELVLKGKGPGNWEWVAGYDAKDDKFLDVNVKYKFGNNANHFVQVGQFKQPGATMEELSSTKNNDFIAKSSITNTLGTPRRVGVQYNYGDVNWGLTGSWFGRELSRNREKGNGYALRGYWAPINETGNILHIGASWLDKDTDEDQVRLRARPMADMVGTRYIDTGDALALNSNGTKKNPNSLYSADRQREVGIEGLWVHGPFKLQGEWMNTRVSRYDGFDDFDGDGFYVSGVWNVTGETWGYKAGVPTTPLPDNPSKGLWQLGLRYDAIDLTDGAVTGGEMDSWTAGVNWYWRSNFKFMLNYVMVDQERSAGFKDASGAVLTEDNPNILEARIQFYW